MKKIGNLFLIGICLIFLITRLFQITEVPASLYWDEASIGYNAYSITQTGKDEWGKRFPINFRAFGEFKLPVYIYSVAISEEIFGVNSFAVRFPSVIYSLGAVVLTFLLGKKISDKKEIGVLSAAILVVMPWFFIFSRTGYEATAGLFFFLGGILLLLFSKDKKWLIFPEVLAFILSLYSYSSYRIIAPLIFVILNVVLVLRKSYKSYLKFFIPALIIFLISLIPFVRLVLFDAGFGRAESFSLIPHIQQVYDLAGKPHYQIIYDRSGNVSWFDNFFGVVKNFGLHLSPQFLFIKGDGNPRDGQSGFGVLYWIDLLMLALGVVYIIRQRKGLLYLPIFLIFLGFLPPSLFKEAPHALRSLAAAPFFAILIAVGIFYLASSKKWLIYPIVLVYLIFFGSFLSSFFQNYNRESTAEWQYGYKQIFTQFAPKFDKYSQIIVSDDYGQPYIFELFYNRYDPTNFTKTVKYNGVSDWGFSTVRSFGKFLFVKNKEIANIKGGGKLIFATPNSMLENVPPSDIVRFQNGQVAFYVYSF